MLTQSGGNHMQVTFRPAISQNKSQGKQQNQKQNPNFGSFPLPETPNDSIVLRYMADWKDLLPTPDNIESMKHALKVNRPGTIGPLQEIVVDIWKMKLEDFPGAAPMIK